MRLPPPDHRERRGRSVLLVWGDAPFWVVVDAEGAKLVDALAAGQSLPAAVATVLGPRPDPAALREAARLAGELKRAGVGGKPRRPAPERIESLTVNVTNRCPLRCAFCYNEPDQHPREELDAAGLIAALDGLRRWTVKGATLALLGGEPLLVPEKTLALAEWAQRRGLRAIVSTNGLFATDEFGARAAALGLDCQVSIDGATAASHEAVRGHGTFERALAGVRALVAAGAHVILSLVLHEGNLPELEAYLRLARELGAAEARFLPVKRVGRGEAWRAPDLPGLVRTVAGLVAREPELGRLLGRDYVSILARTCRTCSPRHGCGVGAQTLLLDADGSVYPCPNLVGDEWLAGRVTETPVGRLWQSAPALRRVREQARLTARPCAGCWARHWCLGGCAGEVQATAGTLGAVSATCAQNRAAIAETFWALRDHPELVRTGPAYC